MTARLFLALTLVSIPAAAAGRTFVVNPNQSTLHIHVGKTGIGSFAGHEHDVYARSFEGEVVADFEDLSRSSVEVLVNTRSLTVTPAGEPEGDAPKVEQAMKGTSVLDIARFPAVRFRSTKVTGKQVGAGSYQLTVAGDLSLHGMTKPIEVPLQAELHGDFLTASGKTVLKQSDYGIEPTTAAGGLVKVEDEVTLDFRLVAKATGP